MQYMAAVLFAHAKEVRDDGSIVEIVIWELPEPLPPSTHSYKYSLFYGIPGSRRVGCLGCRVFPVHPTRRTFALSIPLTSMGRKQTIRGE